jgi:hypothetical protein
VVRRAVKVAGEFCYLRPRRFVKLGARAEVHRVIKVAESRYQRPGALDHAEISVLRFSLPGSVGGSRCAGFLPLAAVPLP